MNDYYLVKKDDLEDLLNNKISIDDLIVDDNLALFTWSGEDVLCELEENNIKVKDKFIFINNVINKLKNFECRNCIKSVIDVELENLNDEVTDDE